MRRAPTARGGWAGCIGERGDQTNDRTAVSLSGPRTKKDHHPACGGGRRPPSPSSSRTTTTRLVNRACACLRVHDYRCLKILYKIRFFFRLYIERRRRRPAFINLLPSPPWSFKWTRIVDALWHGCPLASRLLTICIELYHVYGNTFNAHGLRSALR